MNRRRPLVSWSQVSTATGYKLFWGTTTKNYQFVQNVGNSIQYRVTGLNRNRTYYFAAKAYNKAGDSPYSPEASWKT